MNNTLTEIISQQQAGHQNDPVFMIGEQLKEMAEGDEKLTVALKAFGSSLQEVKLNVG